MSETDFNVAPLKDGYKVDFEKRFTYIENLAKPVLSKIISDRSVAKLNSDEAATVCTFSVVQMLRSKAFRESMIQMPREIRRRFPEIVTNDLPEFFDDSAFEKFSALRFATENIAELATHLICKRMILFERACKGAIYVSDNPLVMHNDREFGPYGNLGLGVPGIQVYHPISPDLILGMLCPSLLSEMHLEKNKALDRINQARLATFRTGSPTLAADMANYRDLADKAASSTALFQAMFDNQHALIQKQNLYFFNSLQLRSSHRFVAAQQDDFSFARRVMSEQPEWKKPLLFKMD